MAVVEIEVGNAQAQSLSFGPLGRVVRGRLDTAKLKEKDAVELRLAWEEFGPIPGQRLGLDVATGEGYLFDPLHEARHSALRQRIEAQGFCLPPERESFPGIDATTWAFWMRRAVEAGLAKITQGSLPENLPGKPRKRFIGTEEKDERDTRLERLERQNERLMALLLATLPADKRRTVERELAQGE